VLFTCCSGSFHGAGPNYSLKRTAARSARCKIATHGGSGRLAQALGGMSYSLKYRAKRAEIWRWYWRSWRQRFWFVHVLFAALIAFQAAASLYVRPSPAQYTLTFVWVFPLVTACFAAVPQLLFKSNERVLEVNPEG
jgi:hypothetical protein